MERTYAGRREDHRLLTGAGMYSAEALIGFRGGEAGTRKLG